jgi:hypothetical protein
MAKAQVNTHHTLTLIGDLFAIAGSVLKSRKDQGVEKLHDMSEATRDYASNLTDLPHLRAQVGAASKSMEHVADYAVHTDVEHMFTDVVAIAKKHPMATLGVTMAAGLFAALLLRSSSPTVVDTPMQRKPAKKKIVAASRGNGKDKPKPTLSQKHA